MADPVAWTVVERDVFAKINGVRPKGEKIVYFVPAADAN